MRKQLPLLAFCLLAAPALAADSPAPVQPAPAKADCFPCFVTPKAEPLPAAEPASPPAGRTVHPRRRLATEWRVRRAAPHVVAREEAPRRRREARLHVHASGHGRGVSSGHAIAFAPKGEEIARDAQAALPDSTASAAPEIAPPPQTPVPAPLKNPFGALSPLAPN